MNFIKILRKLQILLEKEELLFMDIYREWTVTDTGRIFKYINTQNASQIKRNRGLSYTSRRGKGKQVEAVKVGPDCKCKFNSFGHIKEHDIERVFREFWKLGVLRKAKRQKPFIVHAMTRTDFVNVSQMRDGFSQKTATDGFGIRNVVKLEFSAGNPNAMFASEHYSGDLQPISLKKKGRPKISWAISAAP